MSTCHTTHHAGCECQQERMRLLEEEHVAALALMAPTEDVDGFWVAHALWQATVKAVEEGER